MDLFILFDIIKTVSKVSANYAYFLISITIIDRMIKGDFIFDIVDSDVYILWLYNLMDRIYQ